MTPTHPWKALAAAITMCAAVHAVHAQDGEASDAATAGAPDVVHVVARRLALRTACPQAGDELPDALAIAWQDHGRAAVVPVEFTVRGDHVLDVNAAADTARLTHQLRRAVRNLSCDTGDGNVHTVDFVVRFVMPGAADDARVAIVDADDD